MSDNNIISTDGGTFVDGNVSAQADFIGRDKKVVNVFPHFQASPARLRRSFDTLIADKIAGFVGRKFVFDALDEFIQNYSSGYFMIRGVPGIGKSALMAKLIHDRGYIHHFNIALQNIRSTRSFLENITAQLISRYGLSYRELPSSGTDDSGFLLQCLGEAAAKTSNHPVILAIDALDEVDASGLAPNTNLLLLPYSLPAGVYVVVTTRAMADPHLHVAQQQVLDLDADSEGNLRDIDSFISRFTQRPAMQKRLHGWHVEEKQFVSALRKKSQGNFMYLYYVLPAIESGQFVHGTLNEVPEGLIAYYQRHWRQMRKNTKKLFDTTYSPIICVLGVAQEPVSVDQISAWTKLSPVQVKGALDKWREFLDVDERDNTRCFRIYHASFQDFLREQADLSKYDDMIAEYYLSLYDRKR